MLAVGIVFLLLRIPIAQQYAAGAPGTSALPALARAAQEANHYSFWIGMLAVGIGGLLLCRVLLTEGLVPRLLAVYGLAGYAIFLAGAILEILGHNVGVALSIPGGLFEIAFGVLLIAKGFPAGQSHDREGQARNEPLATTAPAKAPGAGLPGQRVPAGQHLETALPEFHGARRAYLALRLGLKVDKRRSPTRRVSDRRALRHRCLEHPSQQAIVDAALLMLQQMGLSPADLVTSPEGPAAGADLRQVHPGGVRCGHCRNPPGVRLVLEPGPGALG